MALLRSSPGHTTSLMISGDGVLLRPFLMTDYVAWAEQRAMSREHLVPWEPMWFRDELSRSAFRRRLRHYAREVREDHGYAFGIFSKDNGELVGGLTLTNVRRGVTQAASLGYWLGVRHSGNGLMSRSINATIPFAFTTLGLHRLEAACMPANTRSVRVLERAGFVREGFSRRYLKINGEWQDHILFAILSDDVLPLGGGHG